MTAPSETLEQLGYYITHLESDPATRQRLRDILDADIARLKAEEAAAAGTADEQRYQTALAGGLPALATGIRDAVLGFQSGDAFAATSAIVGIASTVTKTIAKAIGTAAGPIGGLVGALLDVVSMILKIFSGNKATKTVEQKLDEVIRNYDSETKIQQLGAAKKQIVAFVAYLDKNPNKSDFDKLLSRYNLPAQMDKILTTAEWLKEPKNQGLKHWGDVLAAQCYAYTYFIQALGRAMKSVETEKDVTDLTTYLFSYHPQQLEFLSEIERVARNRGTLWIMNLYASTRYSYQSNWVHTRDAVISKEDWRALRSDWHHLSFTVTTRQLGAKGAGQAPPLALFSLDHKTRPDQYVGWNRGASTYATHPFRKALVANPGGSRTGARFGWAPMDKETENHVMGLPGGSNIQVAYGGERTSWIPDFYDLWATPGFRAGEVNLFTAHGVSLAAWVQGRPEHEAKEESTIRLRGRCSVPNGYKVGTVRAVLPRPFPDEDTSQGVGDQGNSRYVVYGGCEVPAGTSDMKAAVDRARDHMEIRVVTSSHDSRNENDTFHSMTDLGSIPAPWSTFVGIGVDSRYLWVFRAGAIACITHTEAETAVRGGARPPWIQYQVPADASGERYNLDDTVTAQGKYVFPLGLLDLAPCDDGTLTAVLCDKGKRSAGRFYSLTHRIDRKARTLVMEGGKVDSHGHVTPTNGWEKDTSQQTIRPFRVLKQPIPCWGLVEGLKAYISNAEQPGA